MKRLLLHVLVWSLGSHE